MKGFKRFHQRCSIGFIHNFEDAFKITNPTVAGQIVSILPLVPKSSLQQKAVLMCHLVDASPNKRSKRKLKVVFIDDAARIVATLPIDVGDQVSFQNACFVGDCFFEKMASFHEMMLCIGSPQSSNRLRNMFYRMNYSKIWYSLVGQEFLYSSTNIDDYEPDHGSELYVLKSANEKSSMDLSRRDVPSFTSDEEFEFLQSSFQIPEKSFVDVADQSSHVAENALENRKIPTETTDAMISTVIPENSICDNTSHLNGSNLKNIAVHTKITKDFILDAENQIKIPEKMMNYYLYLMLRSITKYPPKSDELQERATRDVVNSPHTAFAQLPRPIPEAPFFIRVSVMVTSPYITSTSSDFSILSLIGFHCDHCSMYFPFLSVEWQLNGDESTTLCSGCDQKGIRSIVDCSFLCEFLLKSELGSLLPAVVFGEDAENFFGCTVSSLSSSSDALKNIRHVFDSLKNTQEFLVLKVIPVCYGNDEYRYHIIC